MPDAVIVSACRTAIGTAGRGTLAATTAFDLAHVVVAESIQRAGIDPSQVDDVILGETLYGGGDVARYAAITAGMVEVPGVAHNRHCASGMAAVQTAAASVRAGMDEVVVAGGTHSSSTMPLSRFKVPSTESWEDPWISPTHPDSPEAPNLDMSITVGWNSAVAAGITREEMDAWALRSHQRAIAAIDSGLFEDEIVPVKVVAKDGSVVTFEVDEHPRRDSSLEKLASLKVLHPEIPGFSITAGNASGMNDAAAALVVMSAPKAVLEGIEPLGTLRSWASVGVEPAQTGLAPVKAIPKALSRAGLSLDEVDLFEINEAFASMCVATIAILGIDPERVNVNGSGCSLGHPVAATGARMLVSLIYELRRRGGGVGVAAMCAGGGMGSATVVEVPKP